LTGRECADAIDSAYIAGEIIVNIQQTHDAYHVVFGEVLLRQRVPVDFIAKVKHSIVELMGGEGDVSEAVMEDQNLTV
jgi:hypothetical protein